MADPDRCARGTVFRNDVLVELLASKTPLEPADYGLNSVIDDGELTGPRWINLWDKDDPIAWPVGPVMSSPLVEDVYVDVSDSVGAAHNSYWDSKGIHEAIAARW